MFALAHFVSSEASPWSMSAIHCPLPTSCEKRVSRDISKILDGWDFDPDQVSVRIVKGEDGREKIQLRLDLGLLQMEVDGRPDGRRPEDCDSWLDYYRQRQAAHDAAHPDSASFQLSDTDCERLLREGIQYYHRYLSFWHLQRYELCARDTNRNLVLFKFVRDHVPHERDRLKFDQWRPYVLLMHARAVATPLAELEDYEAAVRAIDAGIQGIRDFLAEYGQTERADDCVELKQLLRWRKEIADKGSPPLLPAAPADPLEQLRTRLTKAVEDEQFEVAARLRDEIRRVSEMAFPPGSPFPPGTEEKM